jgi:peptide/nickel transport system substrate-binding protein
MKRDSRRKGNRTVSRRLRLSIPAILLASLFIAPAHTTAHADRTISSIPVRCKHRNPALGTITIADNYFGTNFNPYVGNPGDTLLFDDLFRYDSRSRLFPMMATAIPTIKNGGIKDGGKTIIIHLKTGLRWSNGAEITSAAIKFGWQVAMDPATGPACAGTCDVVTRIQTPDRYTVTLRLKQVFPPLLSNLWITLPQRWSGLWDRDAHAAAVKLGQDPSFTIDGPGYPTNGPYQVIRDSATTGAVLRPMPYYDDMTCGGYLGKIVYRGYPSPAAQVAAAASGGMDVGLDYSFPSDLPDLLRHTGPYRAYVQPTFGFEHLEFNLDRTYNGQPNPLSDSRVRQALALALDKRAAIEHALSVPARITTGLLAWSPWLNTRALQQPYADPEITGQWDPLAHGYDSNTGKGQALADARKLLAETRWQRGFTLDFYTSSEPPGRATMMADIAAQWAKIGVKVHQFVISVGALLSDWAHGGVLAHGAFQVGLFFMFGGPQPDNLALAMQSKYIDRTAQNHNLANGNIAGIHDQTIDRAFDHIHTFSQSVRRTNFWVIQRRLNQQAYWIPLYYRPDISTADRRLVGYQPPPIAANEMWNVYAWKVRGS